MARLILTASILLVYMTAYSLGGIQDFGKDLPWTRAINKKLCGPGAHTQPVAKQFFDCYNEQITPGGTKFVECQKEVYGFEMNSEENIDKVCMAPRENFRLYAGCIIMRLISSGQRPSNTLHKLNECQGAVLGVSPPPLESTISNVDRSS